MIIPNWRAVLRKAWSLRFMELAFIFSIAEAVLPLFPDKFPRGIFAILSGIAVGGAYVARFLAQKETHGDAE
jgi:hypothetical protein